jgi:hypothetical protein
MQRIPIVVVLFLLVSYTTIFSQSDTIQPKSNKTRKLLLAGTSGLTTCGSLVAFNEAWYKDYNTGKFHFFNDNAEWLQMDKVGHVYANYQTADLMMKAFSRAGFSRKQTLFIGGGIGFAYMTVIEVMDGYSRGWGFSWGDELCNALGASLAVSQEAFWKQQHVRLKFSYSKSGLAKYRPNTLGDSPATRLLKDYNGQTYWLSFNPFTFSKKKVRAFPNWLSLSLGYSAFGMLGGHYNPLLVTDSDGNVLKFERQRRLYLSLDMDLTKIKTKSKILNRLLGALNILKFPAPALEFSSGKLRFYPIYF